MGPVLGDPIVATAFLDRLLHYDHVHTIRGDSYRLRAKHRSGGLIATRPAVTTPMVCGAKLRRGGEQPSASITDDIQPLARHGGRPATWLGCLAHLRGTDRRVQASGRRPAHACIVGYVVGRARSPLVKIMPFQCFTATIWRRGGDSNPRGQSPSLPHFECGAFNHSATSPGPCCELIGRLLVSPGASVGGGARLGQPTLQRACRWQVSEAAPQSRVGTRGRSPFQACRWGLQTGLCRPGSAPAGALTH